MADAAPAPGGAAVGAAPSGSPPRIAIVGGGLAGLAAAVALAGRGFELQLFEVRRQLGGRAASFHDAESDEWIDHCQHVSMGCCTNLADFCRRTQLDGLFRRDRILHFIGPDGRSHRLVASRWLPAPLHLGPALLRLGYLSLGERLSVARAMWRLARLRTADEPGGKTIGAWLGEQRQSPAAIERFWSVVLVSALGEELDRASLAYARQVFVEGFLSARRAYEVEVPLVPLSELYGGRLERWLTDHGVALRRGTAVRRLEGDGPRVTHLVLADGSRQPVDGAIVAVPWRRVAELFEGPLRSALTHLDLADQIEAAPITGVHLWFDREIITLDHAVLVGRLSQWIFNRGRRPAEGTMPAGHYYQVVISASRSLAGRDRAEVIEKIVGELAAIWPAARQAQLLRSRIVTEANAVFSVRPGIDRLRPLQRTTVDNLALAGDWTSTGWPSTMEGAVRGGYLAAEAILAHFGQPATLVAPGLPRSLLARWLMP